MWAVFVLEQQLRYALGLSTTMQDFFMDPTLPKPVDFLTTQEQLAPLTCSLGQRSIFGSHDSLRSHWCKSM